MSEINIPEDEVKYDFSGKNLHELVEIFDGLKSDSDAMLRSKEAEAVKSSFYKLLGKLRSEAAEAADTVTDTFDAVEETFKGIYADYKSKRAEYNREQEAARASNLEKKKAIIEELKALVEGQEDVNSTFPAFRDIQNRWREAGPVPVSEFRNINDTYQFYVEKFYDMVKINHDLRDLDFRKNLEAKEQFCAAAEKLAENENVIAAFKELQKLHEQWKDFGPVAKEYRDQIWDRFKAATAVINKKYQAHFEVMKQEQEANLQAKSVLCEEVEAIAAKEVTSSNEWNALTKQIEDIQARWRTIGFATRKDNQKIYDRFRAACDTFFARKRDFYSQVKDSMNGNIERKLAIVEQAENLKTSTDWKKTADELIALQKQWKEIGAIPHKKGEQLWARFRAACDYFFAERDKQAKPENDFYGNLKAKKRIVEEINAYASSDDEAANAEAYRSFNERFSAIGFVPFKEKDNISKAFKEALQAKFPLLSQKRSSERQGGRPAKQLSPRDMLVRKYNALQQDITTYENNIGFFAASKGASVLIKQMQDKIDAAKEELKNLENQIREING